MALTPAQVLEMGVRRVQRGVAEGLFINTINLADRMTVDFVWFPGATDVVPSLIDVTMPLTATAPLPREVPYKWKRTGTADITRNMASGRITLPLAPGSSGVLTVFDTQWKITRAALGATLNGSASLQGIQQRLNLLGYHLRAPGATAAGIDGLNGSRTERAVLSFQIDYRLPAGAPAGSPAGPLVVRGEVASNPGIQANLNFYNNAPPAPLPPNPSAADSAQLQLALVAMAGG